MYWLLSPYNSIIPCHNIVSSEFGQHLRDPVVYCVDDGDYRKATGRDDVHPTVDASTATAAEAVAPGRYEYLRPTVSPPSSPGSTKLPCRPRVPPLRWSPLPHRRSDRDVSLPNATAIQLDGNRRPLRSIPYRPGETVCIPPPTYRHRPPLRPSPPVDTITFP